MKYSRLHLLDLTTLVPILIQCGLLTSSDTYTLQNPVIPPIERGSALIYRILPTKGSGAFKKFIECLEKEKEHLGHQEWVQVLKCR